MRLARWRRPAAALTALLLPLSQLQSATPASSRSALYPAPRGHLHFDHAKHTQAACASCHTSASASTRAADSLSPDMAACASCHTGAPDQAPDMRRCVTCHVGSNTTSAASITDQTSWRAVTPQPLITPPARSSSIKFSHAAHAGSACTSCHGSAAAPTMPSMTQCTGCHAADQPAAPPSTCQTCHIGQLAQPSPTATTPALASGKRLMPGDHTVDWIKRHGPLSRAAGDTCSSCHTPPSCASCHGSQQAGPYKAHPPNFIAIHNAAARGDMASCTDCHKVETFCTSCHARTLNLPDAPSSPPPRLAYHPPGWLDARSAGNHGVQARRNISDCASCHQERDCVSCHQGINPHPDTFALDCKRLLDANPAPCIQCHTSQDALRMMCR